MLKLFILLSLLSISAFAEAQSVRVPGTFVPLCQRSAVIQKAIAAASGLSGCDVTAKMLSSIQSLKVSPVRTVGSSWLASLEASDLTGLSGLKSFHLNGMSMITEIPEEIFDNTPNLKVLDLGGNVLETNHREISRRLFSNLKHLEVLNLSQQYGRWHLSREVFAGLTSLEELRLGGSKVYSIDIDTFADLKALEFLSFGKVENTSTLPEQLFSSLTQLKRLNLAGNGLTELPPTIFSAQAMSLEELDVGLNPMPLPVEALNHLKSLKKLIMKSMPALLGDNFKLLSLPSLTEIILYGNRLKRLPAKAFSGMGALIKVDLTNNWKLDIDGNAFDGCSALHDVYLADSAVEPAQAKALRANNPEVWFWHMPF